MNKNAPEDMATPQILFLSSVFSIAYYYYQNHYYYYQYHCHHHLHQHRQHCCHHHYNYHYRYYYNRFNALQILLLFHAAVHITLI